MTLPLVSWIISASLDLSFLINKHENQMITYVHSSFDYRIK